MDGGNSIESCQSPNTRCSGPWLHTVDWIEIGNRKIQEAKGYCGITKEFCRCSKSFVSEGDLCRYGFPPSSRHVSILPNAQRKRIPTGPHTPWPNRAEMGVRSFKNLDQTTLELLPQVDARKAPSVRNTQVTSSDKTPVEFAMGRKPRDLLDQASMNPEQLTSTPTKQDLLHEEIQKMALKSHLEVQQPEDIRRDLAGRMKFVPPDLRTGEHVFFWQEDPSKIQQGLKSGKWLKVEIIAVKGSMAVVNAGW